MKILLFGSRGQVGTALTRCAAAHLEILAPNIDITDFGAINTLVCEFVPDVIVNAAAYTNVNQAESEREKAFAVNAIAPAHMAEAARKTGALFVNYSTDYVYDGSGQTPWTETDHPAPLNVYGASKLEGDTAIMSSGCRYLILRTSWVYSHGGQNFIKSILDLAHKKTELTVISDQIGAPTSADFLAQSTYAMVDKVIENPELCGLYHVCANGETSWYSYARFILEKAGLSKSCQIIPVLSKDYQQKATRPLNSRLNLAKIQEKFGIVPLDWKEESIKYIAQN